MATGSGFLAAGVSLSGAGGLRRRARRRAGVTRPGAWQRCRQGRRSCAGRSGGPAFSVRC